MNGNPIPMKLLSWFVRLFVLAGFGCVGFYVYGVAMGTFSPAEMVLVSVLAAFFTIVNVVHAFKARRDLHAMKVAR